MGIFDALLNPSKPVPTTIHPIDEKVRKSANPQEDKSISQQTRKSASPQVDITTSPQNNIPARPQVDKSTSGQVDKSANEKTERYTTRLQPSLIKQMKRYAFEHERNDYDVVQN